MLHLRGHCLRLGDLLRLEALTLEHVLEVHVATDIELVRAVEDDAAVLEELRHDPMRDGGAHLALDVVSHDRQTGCLELRGPLGITGDEHRKGVHEGAACIDRTLGIELRRSFRTHRQIADDDIDACLTQSGHDVHGLGIGLGDRLPVVATEAIEGVSALHDHAGGRHIADADRVVLRGIDRVGEIGSDLLGIDVECGHEVHITHVIRPERDMHEPGNSALGVGILVVLDPLHERGGAVPDADDGDADLIRGHVRPSVIPGIVISRRGVEPTSWRSCALDAVACEHGGHRARLR